MSWMEYRLAQPGDPDLVFDMDGVTILSVLVHEREVLLGLTHGFGFWINEDAGRVEVPPGSDAVEASEGEILISLVSASPAMFDFMVGQLHNWQERKVPLRICIAPGRCSTMIEDRDRWIPLPWRSQRMPGG